MDWQTILLAGSSVFFLGLLGCNEDPVGGGFTFDAGQNDTGVPSTAEEWFETACETTSPGDVTVQENQDGNWAFALPKGDFEYFNLPISGFDAPHAGALIDHSNGDVAGAVASGPGSIDDFEEPDKSLRRALLDRLPDGVETPDFGSNLSAEYETHDGRRARTLTSPLLTDSAMAAGQLRNDILFALADFDHSDIWFVEPEFDGTAFSSFRLRLTLQSMPSAGDGGGHWVIALSVEPTEPNDEQTRIAAVDMAGSHNLAVAGSSFSAQCDRSTMVLPTPYYLYFVIDVDGPAGWAGTVENYVTQVSERIAQISPRYRLQIGITNTVAANEGRFFREADWLERGEVSVDAVRRAATVCQETNGWQCGGERDGLAVAEAGLQRMDRPESGGGEGPSMKPADQRQLAVIFISDEEPASVQSGNRTAASYRESLQSHNPWVVQVIGPQSDCGSKPLAKAYRGIDADSVEDLCALPTNAGELNRIVREVFAIGGVAYETRALGSIQLSETPISPSLRMFQNADGIVRDDADGFRYQPDLNQVELRGGFSPWQVDYFGGPYFNVVRYYSWD